MNTILSIISIPLILLTIINGIQKLIQNKIDKDNALENEREKVKKQTEQMTRLLSEIFVDILKNQKNTTEKITNIKLSYVASVQKAINHIKEI